MNYNIRDIKFINRGFDSVEPTFRGVFLDSYHGGLGHPGEFREQGLLGAVESAEAFNALPEDERTPEARSKILEDLETAMNDSLRSVVNHVLRGDAWDEDIHRAVTEIKEMHNVTEATVTMSGAGIFVDFYHDNDDGDFLDNDLANDAIKEVREILDKHGLSEFVLESNPAVRNAEEGHMFFHEGFVLYYAR